YGGGLYNAGNLIIANCTIMQNTISGTGFLNNVAGAGIYNIGTLSISNTTISGNIAKAAISAGAVGGGIYSTGTLTISNSTTISNNSATISDNSAVSNFGGIFSSGNLTIANSTISNNDGGSGGTGGFRGAICGGIYVQVSANASIDSSIISGNSGIGLENV